MSLLEPFRRLRAPDETDLRRAAADALVESYVAWREASSSVRVAYERWRRCESRDREIAFAGYLAALQQEDQAARVYERRIGRVRGVCPVGADPSTEAVGWSERPAAWNRMR
jgi:hypothetical protein